MENTPSFYKIVLGGCQRNFVRTESGKCYEIADIRAIDKNNGLLLKAKRISRRYMMALIAASDIEWIQKEFSGR